MTSRELYKRFTSLCQRWPIDETKAGRDYGQVLRDKLTAQFPHGELSHVKNPEEVNATLGALEKIANNTYFNENVLKRSSASGTESWVCREAISTESLKNYDGQDEDTLIGRLKKNLSTKFSGSESSRVESEASAFKKSKTDKQES